MAEMRTHRLFTEHTLEVDTQVQLESRPAKHAFKVLRLGTGDPLVLFDGRGHDFQCEIADPPQALVRVCSRNLDGPEPEPPLRIELALGVSRGERMDFAIQKAVELGVYAIQPLFTGRSVVRLDGQRLQKRVEHWRGVVIAACEQSGRRRLPRLACAMHLDDWLRPGRPTGILLHHAAAQSIARRPAPGDRLSILIGPEGGLTPDERERAQSAGLTPVRLGPRVLRTETAPLAAIAAAQVLWGDLQ